MHRAMLETDRRRAKQEAYNKEHNITPKGIAKAVHDILEGARPELATSSQRYAMVAEKVAKYEAMTPQEVAKKLKAMENKMLEHAHNLEFEEAAQVRDEIKILQDGIMGLDG